MDRQPRTAAVVVAVGLSCWGLGYLFAAPATRAKESGGVLARPVDGFRAATIDINLLFKGDPKFIRLREELTSNVQAAEKELRGKNEQLEAKKQQLVKLAQSSDAFRKLKTELEIEAALLQSSLQEQKTALARQESEVYWTCYQDMSRLIEEYCEQHGIQMVVRAMKEPIDPKNPQDIAKELNRQVVYDKGIDLTETILQQLQALPDRETP